MHGFYRVILIDDKYNFSKDEILDFVDKFLYSEGFTSQKFFAKGICSYYVIDDKSNPWRHLISEAYLIDEDAFDKKIAAETERMSNDEFDKYLEQNYGITNEFVTKIDDVIIEKIIPPSILCNNDYSEANGCVIIDLNGLICHFNKKQKSDIDLLSLPIESSFLVSSYYFFFDEYLKKYKLEDLLGQSIILIDFVY